MLWVKLESFKILTKNTYSDRDLFPGCSLSAHFRCKMHIYW